jgi:hypothetical protein
LDQVAIAIQQRDRAGREPLERHMSQGGGPVAAIWWWLRGNTRDGATFTR